jgi:hypothetical protein
MYLPHTSSTASSKQSQQSGIPSPKVNTSFDKSRIQTRGRLYRSALGARRRRVKINEARHQQTPSSPWRDASQYPSSHGSKPRKSETLARISCCFFFTLLPSISNRSAEAWIGRSRTSSQDHTHGAEARCARAVDEVCNASGRLEALAFWFWLRG